MIPRALAAALGGLYLSDVPTTGHDVPTLHEVIETVLPGAVLLLVATIVFLVVRRTARRFEAEQIRKGLWDENGPLHPTAKAARYARSASTLHLNLGDNDDAPVPLDSLANIVETERDQPKDSLLAHEYRHPRPRRKEE